MLITVLSSETGRSDSNILIFHHVCKEDIGRMSRKTDITSAAVYLREECLLLYII